MAHPSGSTSAQPPPPSSSRLVFAISMMIAFIFATIRGGNMSQTAPMPPTMPSQRVPSPQPVPLSSISATWHQSRKNCEDGADHHEPDITYHDSLIAFQKIIEAGRGCRCRAARINVAELLLFAAYFHIDFLERLMHTATGTTIPMECRLVVLSGFWAMILMKGSTSRPDYENKPDYM